MVLSCRQKVVLGTLAIAIGSTALAGCGDSSSRESASTPTPDYKAIDRAFNGGYTPVLLHNRATSGGGISHCGINLDQTGHAQLTVLMHDGSWFEAKIDPVDGVAKGDVTVGADFRAVWDGTLEDFLNTTHRCAISSRGVVTTAAER